MRTLIGQLASTICPWVHAKKLSQRGKIEVNSANLLSVKCTDEKNKWKVEVGQNTQLSFWRRVKRSCDKFAPDEFITVFFAAWIRRRKTSEQSLLRIEVELSWVFL